MTNETLERAGEWARQNGYATGHADTIEEFLEEILFCVQEINESTLKISFNAGREVEREACAQVCDRLHYNWCFDHESDSESGPRECAAAIRARGGEK
jgi:hypothetical protein